MPKIKKKESSSESKCQEKKPRGQYHRTVRSEETILKVKESVMKNPTASIRQRAQELGITPKTLQRILKEDLNFVVKKIVENNPVPENNEKIKTTN